MRTQEMLKFVPDHLRTKKMCKHAVKKLPYLIRYVPDGYKTQHDSIRDKAILENGGTLKSVPDRYKNQEMYNNAVDNYPHALEFVPECFMTQEMCDKAVNTHSSTIELVPECYKTQKMGTESFNKCFLALFDIPD